ncbi:helix-turn-helix domain-containing protein [Streptococcus pasteurianus]
MFTTFDRVKELSQKRGISLSKLEETLGLGKNSIYALKRNQPSAERLQEIADYFNVSTDYLLGRTDNPIIAKSNDKDSETPQYRAIQRKAKSLSVADQERLIQIMDLTFQDMFNGGENDDHDFK